MARTTMAAATMMTVIIPADICSSRVLAPGSPALPVKTGPKQTLPRLARCGRCIKAPGPGCAFRCDANARHGSARRPAASRGGPICVRRLPVIPAAPGRLGDRLSDTQEESKQPDDQRGQRKPPQDMYGESEPAQDQDDQQGREDHGHGTLYPARCDARESR